MAANYWTELELEPTVTEWHQCFSAHWIVWVLREPFVWYVEPIVAEPEKNPFYRISDCSMINSTVESLYKRTMFDVASERQLTLNDVTYVYGPSSA